MVYLEVRPAGLASRGGVSNLQAQGSTVKILFQSYEQRRGRETTRRQAFSLDTGQFLTWLVKLFWPWGDRP